MLLTVLSLALSIASAADLDEDGCEDSFDIANGACVDPDATLASGVTVGATAVVGTLADIGADTALGAGTYIGARTTIAGRSALSGARPIGADTIIGRSADIGIDHNIGINNTIGRTVQAGERLTTEANVAIGYGTVLGDDVTLRSGSVVGNVSSIGGNTDVAASAVISRGVTILDSTGTASIAGVIGPNVSMGADNDIASTARIRKSATLGNNVTVLDGARISRDAIIGNDVTIGAGARIGAGATVTATTVVGPGVVVPRGETLDDPSVGQFAGGTLLNSTEMDQINGWVGDPNANWTLCYKKSVDGNSTAAFHSGCDNISGTVTVIQEAGGKKFGGYTPLLWNHFGNYRTESPRRSFLFSLTNNFKHLPYRYNYDIYAHSAYGPTFGGGHDLTLRLDANTSYCNLGHDYQCRVGGYSSSTCRDDLCGDYILNAVDIEVYGRD